MKLTEATDGEIALHPGEWFSLIFMAAMTVFAAYEGHSWVAACVGCCTGMELGQTAEKHRHRRRAALQHESSLDASKEGV